MKIVINGREINHGENYSEVLKHLLLFRNAHFVFQPVELIKKDVDSLLNLATEGFNYEKERLIDGNKDLKKKLSLLLRKITLFKKSFSFYNRKEKIIEQVYNLILSLESLSLLHGFGFSNKFGDKLIGNSEKQSLYNKNVGFVKSII